MERILILHQHFRLPEEGGGVRSFHIAQFLAEKGHHVVIIRSRGKSFGKIKLRPEIELISLPVPYSNEMGFWKRIKSFLAFNKEAYKVAKGLRGSFLVYAISTPLSIGWLAQKLKNRLNHKYVFEVGDLWPDVPIQMGYLKNPILKLISRRLERKSYEEAAIIVGMSSDISNRILEISPRSRIITIPNFSETDFFKLNESTEISSFKIGYFGAAGEANGLEHLLTLARYSLENDLSCEFHFAIEGKEAREIQSIGTELSNVHIHPYGSKNHVRTLMEEVHATFVSYANFSILGTGSPNKFFDGLAAGKVILTNVKGWFQQLIEKENCGYFISRDKPEDFQNIIIELNSKPEMLAQKSLNARSLAEREFSKEVLLPKWYSGVFEETTLKG